MKEPMPPCISCNKHGSLHARCEKYKEYEILHKEFSLKVIEERKRHSFPWTQGNVNFAERKIKNEK